MTGMRNHSRLKGARLLTKHAHTNFRRDYWLTTRTTSNGYSAPILTEGIPGVPKGSIWGEVYEIDNDMLLRLDMFEGHPDVYERRKIEIEYENKRRSYTSGLMWTYFYNGPSSASQDYIDHSGIQGHSTIMKWMGEAWVR